MTRILSLHLNDQKYFKFHPSEDSLSYTQDTFVVADGITRDPLGILNFHDFKEEDIIKAYPNPSPAKIAADTFANSFLSKFSSDIDSLEKFKNAFKVGNRSIKELNNKNNPNPNYLDNDYWACVAAAAHIKDSKIFWGVIGDCRIKIFDKNGKLKFASPNSVETFEKFFYGPNNARDNFDWFKPESRVLVRKEFRNNPGKVSNGKNIGYGALTGEETAEEFMYFGELALEKKDLLILFSDGFESTIDEPNFFELASKAIELGNIAELKSWCIELGKRDYKSFGREGSMILIQV